MESVKKVLVKTALGICAIVSAFSAAGQSATLSWQTTPILGTSTGYDGNVLVYTDSGVATIPHVSMSSDPLYGIGLPSMTLFHVGQTVDAGSGIYYGNIGDIYHWTVTYAGPSRTVTYSDNYTGIADLFVMNYLDPVSILTPADVGMWNYTEAWVNTTTDSEPSLSYSTDFAVALPAVVPEPASLALLGIGLAALGFSRRRRS